jgi:4-carboxymuconolactone decarboxylase
MRHLIKIAVIAAAIALPQFTVAQDSSPMRFPPIPMEKLTPKQKQFAEAQGGGQGGGQRASNFNQGPFRLYLRSPDFGLAAIQMSDYLRWGTGLEPRLVELAILIAARNWSSSYVWHSHYPLAMKGGLDPSVGADIAAGRRPAKMKEDETLIYDLLTQIYRDRNVTDATFNASVAKFGDKGLADIVAIAAYYGVTSMSLIATKTTAEPTDEPPLQTLTQVFPR